MLEPLKVAQLRVAIAVPVASTDGELETAPLKEAAMEGELTLPLEFGLTDGLVAPEGEPALVGDAAPDALLLPLAEGATLTLALPHSDLVETLLGDSAKVAVEPPEFVMVAVEEAEAHKVIELVKLVVRQAEGAPLALLEAQFVASGEYESEAEPQLEAEGKRLSEEKADSLGEAIGDLEYKPDAVPHREGACDGVLHTDIVTVVVAAGEAEVQGEGAIEAVDPPVGGTDPEKGNDAEGELLGVPKAVCEGLPLPQEVGFMLPDAAAEELAPLDEAAGDTVGQAVGERDTNGLPESEFVAVPHGELSMDIVPWALAERLPESVGEREPERDKEGLPEWQALAVPHMVAPSDAVPRALKVEDNEGHEDADVDPEAHADAVEVLLTEPHPDCDRLAVPRKEPE